MDCTTFEREIGRRLAGTEASGDDAPALAALEAHAAGCPACRGAADLVVLAAADPDDRFPFCEPDAAGWAAIDERLAIRLAPERRGRPGGRLGAVATSVAAVVVCGLMLVSGSRNGRKPVTTAATARSAIATSEADRAGDGPLGSAASFDWSDPTGADAGDPVPVPDLDALDGREREELLDWIRDEMSRIEGDAA